MAAADCKVCGSAANVLMMDEFKERTQIARARFGRGCRGYFTHGRSAATMSKLFGNASFERDEVRREWRSSKNSLQRGDSF
jgi:hypothetical protein